MNEFFSDVPTARLLVDPARSGAWNMAVDEALLESAAGGGPTTLRLYQWETATVSLGYFQRETPEIEPDGRFHGLPAVRRLSGGGAILHDRELTYSVTIPETHPLAETPTRLYDVVHASIAAALAEWGITVEPRGVTDEGNKTFLCFARGDRRDLVCKGFKVVGSAQRRRGRAILQHGSVLLSRSPWAPEFPGLAELSGTPLDPEALQESIARHCEVRLFCRWSTAALTHQERQRSQDIFNRRASDGTSR